jgi:hypothetical protein
LLAELFEHGNGRVTAAVVNKEDIRRGIVRKEMPERFDVEAMGFVVTRNDQTDANDVLIM